MIPTLLISAVVTWAPAPQDSVYAAVMMRAAPGSLLELIELLQRRMPVYDAAGEHRPVVLRHAQGDHWDVLLLTPIGTMAEHFGAARGDRWRAALRRVGFDESGFWRELDRSVSWREELYVTGPPVARLDSALVGAGYFHLEIFQALAGKRDSLLRQRHMENDFLRRVGRPTNLIFRKLTGPAWDAFTLGLYRDLPHYAAPLAVSAAEEQAAARAAGFESRIQIGPYLRRFLNGHHDTLGPILP